MVASTSRLFSRNSRPDIDEEQLLKLFWNRAELKKELEALEKANSVLEEQSQQKDTLLLRLQQRLSHLEALLSDPDEASTAVTYYQLRGVWNHCNQALQALALEMRRIGEERAIKKCAESSKADLDAAIAALDQQAAALGDASDALAIRIQSLRDQRKASTGFFASMSRRKLTTEIDIQRQNKRELNGKLEAIAERKREALSVARMKADGLNVRTKRQINLVVIAYAQELYLQLSDQNIAQLARDAALNQINDVSYGGHRDCRAIRKNISERMQLLSADKQFKSRVELRSRKLAAIVDYRTDNDAVPMAGTLSSIQLFNSAGDECGEVGINILADEYWDIFSVLKS